MTRRTLVPFVLLLVAWPLTYRYTSLGIDSDAAAGAAVDSTYYRVRWPGDGCVFIGYLIERHPGGGDPIDSFDLGGTFLRPPRAARPVTWANRLGFWWINVDRDRGDADSPAAPHAQRAVMVGIPHGLLVIVAGIGWLIQRRRRRFARPRTLQTTE